MKNTKTKTIVALNCNTGDVVAVRKVKYTRVNIITADGIYGGWVRNKPKTR